MSVPTTLLLKRTTPRQALLPLLGTLSGAMIAGTLSLQDTTSRQRGRKWACSCLGSGKRLCACVKGREFTVSVSQTHGVGTRTLFFLSFYSLIPKFLLLLFFLSYDRTCGLAAESRATRVQQCAGNISIHRCDNHSIMYKLLTKRMRVRAQPSESQWTE